MANTIGVSALNRYVRSLLEGDPFLEDIVVSGEISNYNRHYASGHCYFTLKDEKSNVKAVMFRSAAEKVAFRPENGMGVLARGRISLYERDGTFQFYVEHLFPAGEGAIQLVFAQLKARLEKEGLFAPEHKKPLPEHPRCIGLVSSKTGAAFFDVCAVAQRRCPDIDILFAPVPVQGLEASEKIAQAIRRLDESGEVDLILVVRGGGSAEDLWAFNEEEVIRAAYNARTPIVSGVGHEVDVTLLDYVADLRAATPSAAAEIALPDRRMYLYMAEEIYRNIANHMHMKFNLCYTKWEQCLAVPALQKVKHAPEYGRAALAQWEDAIREKAHLRLGRKAEALRFAGELAAELNPYAVLARGYAAVSVAGKPLKSVEQVAVGDSLGVHLRDGLLEARVEKRERKQKNG